jgi:hypothetical protein
MPSPIKRYTQGTFEHVKSGTTVSASTKYPVLAYKRDYKGNKGAWKFKPTKSQNARLKGREKNGYHVSIVRARGIKSTVGLDKGRASDKGAPASASYRHTSDYLRRGDGSIDSVGYPAGKKQPAPKVSRTTRVRGQKKAGGKAKPINVMVEKKVKEAKALKKKAVKQKDAAEKAKTPKVKKEKAKKAEATAKKAQTKAKQVVESPKATKAQKEAARGTKRAAKKTEKSAKKVVKKAEKAKKKSKDAAKKAGV